MGRPKGSKDREPRVRRAPPAAPPTPADPPMPPPPEGVTAAVVSLVDGLQAALDACALALRPGAATPERRYQAALTTLGAALVERHRSGAPWQDPGVQQLVQHTMHLHAAVIAAKDAALTTDAEVADAGGTQGS